MRRPGAHHDDLSLNGSEDIEMGAAASGGAGHHHSPYGGRSVAAADGSGSSSGGGGSFLRLSGRTVMLFVFSVAVVGLVVLLVIAAVAQQRQRQQRGSAGVGGGGGYNVFAKTGVSSVAPGTLGILTASDFPVVVPPGEHCSFERLVEWAKAGGAKVKKISQADFPLENGQGTRRGIAAGEYIRMGHPIVELPLSLSMSPVSAYASELRDVLKANPQLESLEVMILHVLHEARKPDSKWWPVLCLMPRSVPLPMFYTDQELQELSPVLLRKAETARIFAKQRYNLVMPLMHNQYPELFPKTETSVRDFCWALALVLSRTWGVATDFSTITENTTDTMHLLMGLGDQFNHNVSSLSASFKHGVMTVYAHRDTQPGEELFLSYGPRCNAKFLMTYGFVPMGNEGTLCPDEIAAMQEAEQSSSASVG